MTTSPADPDTALDRAAAHSDPDGAVAILADALVVVRATDDSASCCRLLNAMGGRRRDAGDLKGALALFLEARQAGLRGAVGPQTMAAIESSIAFSLIKLGLTDEAVEYAVRAHEIAERLPPCETRAQALNALALTQTRIGHFRQAEATYRLAVREARASKSPLELFRAYVNRGVAVSEHASRDGLSDAARGALLRRQQRLNAVAESLIAGSGAPPHAVLLPLINDIDALAKLGQLDEADARFAELPPEVISMVETVGVLDRIGASACAQKAAIEFKRGRFERSAELLTRAMSARQGWGETETRASLLHALSEVREAQGDYRAALQATRQAARLQLDIAEARSEARLRMLEVTQGLDQARALIDHERKRFEAIDLQRQALQDEAVRLVHASQTDALTGLGNRRMLADLACLLAVTQGEPVGLGVIDLDHFKRVNDSFGHAMGDTVLATVAKVLQRTCRPGDSVMRLGGEEFVVVLRRASASNAERTFERLCAAVRRHMWQEVHPKLQVSISIGAVHATTPVVVDELMAMADARLYDAKRNGRDRVCMTASS